MAPKGLFKVLGPREQEVMEVFWQLGRSTTVEIQSHLPHVRVSTVTITIGYLVAKGFLAKETASRRCDGHFYTPIITKEQLMLRAVQYMLDDIHATPGERGRLAEALWSEA
jgi:predicted transcriptional regulator